MREDEKPEYILFIDEAGDDGLKRVRPIDTTGASEWLCISGFLVRSKYEPELDDWISDLRRDINATQSSVLHYKNLSLTKRKRAAEILAGHTCRGFIVASNKKNMRKYNNERAAQKHGNQQVHWFYNWCVRLLLERATEFCFEKSMQEHHSPKIMKVVFSKRGGHNYGQTKAYWELLKLQQTAGTTVKNASEIRPEVLRYRQVEHLPHYCHAGLQFADLIASCFYQAVDILDVPHNPEPAKLLKPIMARKKRNARNFGVTLMPTPPEKAELEEIQKDIFKFYGYRFLI